MTYFILYILCTIVCWPWNSSMVRRFGTSRLYRLIRMTPREENDRKKILTEALIVNAIAYAGILFLVLSIISFWESLKTIGP
ncbi:hypothetical protein YWY31_06080 [Paenibacillus illinoisensis]